MPQFNVDLNIDSLDGLIKDLQEYSDKLEQAPELVVNELWEIGYKVAKPKVPNVYSGYIFFLKENYKLYRKKAYLELSMGSSDMVVNWYPSRYDFKKGVRLRTVAIKPHLMAEVGSGNFVENPMNIPGGKQGALNTYGHAFDSSWSYVDESGEICRSSGFAPTMPMYHARNEIIRRAKDVVAKVIGSG